MGHSWDPERYLTFGDERSRPFFDLVGRVRAESPSYVVDLGCGPGNVTATLAERWPDADVHGVDSSKEMIDQARQHETERLTFEVGDLRDFRPDRPVDVMVSNATLQWIPDHLNLLPHFVNLLSQSGWLALQVPGNFDDPHYRLLREIADAPKYSAHTHGITLPSAPGATDYLRALLELGCQADVWETTYLHVLHGPDPVFRWKLGTGARPVLQALPDDLRAEFEKEYAAALREAYPATQFGTVLPFRRIFAVARKGTAPSGAKP